MYGGLKALNQGKPRCFNVAREWKARNKVALGLNGGIRKKKVGRPFAVVKSEPK